MLDLFHIPSNENTQVFLPQGAGVWQTWRKPRNCNFVYIFNVGGGGGGGGGCGSANNNTSGGGGGAASSVHRVLFQAALLPDILYILPGMGGTGGAGGTNATGSLGGAGGISYVSVRTSTAVADLVSASGATAPNGGAGGVSVSSGTAAAGAAGTAFIVNTNGILASLGFNNSGLNSVVGSNGTTNVNAATVTNVFIFSGGAGGGGSPLGGATAYNGGGIGATGIIPAITGGAGSTVGNGANGSGGFQATRPSSLSTVRLPIYCTGGCGGGASSNLVAPNTGGNGGNGAFGCGGGGGGGSFTGTGGRGGDGGSGIVVIVAF